MSTDSNTAMPVVAWRAWITDAFQPGGGYWTALLRKPCTDIPTEPLVKRAHAEAAIAALQREVEELRADALRYRWLRDRAPGEINFDYTLDESNGGHYFELHVPFDGREIPDDDISAATLNEAIDAAMASKAEVPNV